MKKLGEILVEAQVISADELDQALKSRRSGVEKIGTTLVRAGLITDEVLVKAIAKQMRLPILDLRQLEVPENLLRIFPKEVMLKHVIIPVALKGLAGKENLIVAMADPTDQNIVRWLQEHSPHALRIGIASERNIMDALSHYDTVLINEKNWKPVIGAKNAPAQVEDTASVSVKVSLEEESEITQFTRAKEGVFDAIDRDADILAALSEPTSPGTVSPFKSAKPAVKPIDSPKAPAPALRLEEASRLAAPAPQFVTLKGEKAKERPKSLQAIIQTTPPQLLLEALIQLMIERDLISVEELQETLEAKK